MTLRHAARRFADDRRGIAAIEFVMIAPVLCLLLFAAVTFFVAFRTAQDAEKATFVVADILARRTTVDTSFLKTVDAIFQRLLAEQTNRSSLNVRSLKRSGDKYTVDWYYPASAGHLKTDVVRAEDLPLVADGDSVLLVNSRVTIHPITTLGGLTEREVDNVAAARPRFTSAIVKTD